MKGAIEIKLRFFPFAFFIIGVSLGMFFLWLKNYQIGGIITTCRLIIFHIMRSDVGLSIGIERLSAQGLLF